MADPDYSHHEHKSRDDLIRELLEVQKQVVICRQDLSSLSRQFRTLIEPWVQAVWEADAQGITVSDSSTWRHYTGQPRKEMLSTGGWKKAVHPDDQEYALKKWKAAIESIKPMDITFRLSGSDGGYRWTNVRAAPLMDPDGSVQKWVGMNIDVHDRKVVEKALKESEMQFRQLSDAMPQLVWSAGPDGSVKYVNQRSSEYIQIEMKEDGTLDWTVLLHEEDRERTIKIWQDALKKGITYQAEHRLCRADQTYHWHLSRAMPVYDSKGDIAKWFGTATDIETIKQAEAFHRHMNEILEQKVTERTKIAEARAKELQALAVDLVQAEELERQRIALFLHEDLQQMIASARMQIQLASRQKNPGPVLETVEQLLGVSLEKSRHLSHDLSPPVLQQLGLPAALKWLARHMEEQFGMKVHLEITASRELKEEPLKVFLFRAAQELLFNAFKHSQVNQADVRLADSNKAITLSVNDQGRGFDPEILESFERRSGLGLISLRERAAAIGGNLNIDSALGQGCRFTLVVPPRLSSPNEPEKRDRQTFTADSGNAKPTISESELTKVLFVDDHKVMRQGLISIIAYQPGIRVAGEAESGEEALELARKLRPDVIIMDISMPGIGGLEATRAIKAEMPDIKIIGLSMFAEEEISLKLSQAGANGFISKSESSSELLKKIYEVAGHA